MGGGGRPGKILFEMEGVTPEIGGGGDAAGGAEAADPDQVRDAHAAEKKRRR